MNDLRIEMTASDMPMRLISTLTAMYFNGSDDGNEDSYFEIEHIRRACNMIKQLCVHDERLMVFPTSRRSIQVEWEWEHPELYYCEIEIYEKPNNNGLLASVGEYDIISTDKVDDDEAVKLFMKFVDSATGNDPSFIADLVKIYKLEKL